MCPIRSQSRTNKDAPTGNLDEDTALEITNILREAAWEYGKCVVMVTHSSEVAKQADISFSLKMKQGYIQII